MKANKIKIINRNVLWYSTSAFDGLNNDSQLKKCNKRTLSFSVS